MKVNGVAYRTVWLEGDVVKLIDQQKLPFQFEILSLKTPADVAEAIRDMTVRGAGAIGAAAGYAMAQAALQAPERQFDPAVALAAQLIRSTRPTARNLFYAVERVQAAIVSGSTGAEKRRRAVEAAQAIADEDAAAAEQIGQVGLALFGERTSVLTHCNAGWLAFTDWGTALAPVYAAHRAGREVQVYLTETRPRSQGAKLTTWELAQEGVPHTLVPDMAAGQLMQKRLVDLVIVGADRVAANGDAANKIGTYALAVLARTHGLPFYIALPTSTIDLTCPGGQAIPIEERSDDEVLWVTGQTRAGRLEQVRIAPVGTHVRNWAFDVTPAEFVTGLITERGLISATAKAIRDVLAAEEKVVPRLSPDFVK